MVTAFPRLRTAYLVGNGLATAIMFVASFVNLFVGPRNLGLFFLPLIEAGFATLTLIMVDLILRQLTRLKPPPLWLGRFGVLWRWLEKWNGLIVATAFLCGTPAFFLIVSSLLLYAATTGTINP